jgi:hypothetical protein
MRISHIFDIGDKHVGDSRISKQGIVVAAPPRTQMHLVNVKRLVVRLGLRGEPLIIVPLKARYVIDL